MTQFIIFLIIGVVGIVIGYYFALKNKAKKLNKHVAGQVAEREKNKAAILKYAISREQITNDEIEELLGVSDATAERYLDELEKEGRLKQVGRTGRSTFYKKAF